MQNLSTQDSIKTKQLLPDRFWIIEHNGSRIGTIQRHDENNFVVTGIDSSIAQIIYTKSNQNASGMMRITSNDPDESEIEVLLVA